MGSKEVEQWLQWLPVAKHNRRQVTIKELNTITNGWGSDGAREVRIERFKVKLKYKVSIDPDISMQIQ